MPYSGAGTFALYSPGNPVVTGTTISSTWANNTLSDIATGLSTAVTKDGQTTTTASVPFAQGINVTSPIISPSTTFALVNTTATTVNFAGAATTLNIGAATGTTTVVNALSGTIATDSSSSTTGAWKTAGGLGVAKAVYVGTTLNVGGISTLTKAGTFFATGTAPDATPVNIFSTLTAGGVYLVTIGSGDNNVRCMYFVYYNGGTVGFTALDTSNFTISFSGAQMRLVNGSGSPQSYNATCLRLG